MKLITRNTDYALRAICYIARADKKIVSVAELVDALKIPRAFLRKLLQILNRKKLLKSSKGKNGGFLLTRTCANIMLIDLIDIFQGPLKLNDCLFKKRACPNTDFCRLRKRINSIEKYVISELNHISIADLLDKGA